MDLNPKDLTQKENYKLLIGSIVPRPIAFVSTQGEKGSNVAPFSFFTCVSTDPPMIGFTSMPGPYGDKDTLRNIRETGEFIVNVVSHSFVEKVNISASDTPPGVSEFDEAQLTEIPGTTVNCPRVAEAKIHLECKMHSILEHGAGPDRFVIGEIVEIHVNDEIMMERLRIDMDGLEPIGRMAGHFYVVCDNLIKVKRKTYQGEKANFER
jgi:flavin reductase (DIM6/NTAB) family NADH-FMN oxidoreductase RutF